MAAATRVLTDHDEIRQWAEERGASPARVKGTGGRGDPGILRLDFPGFTGEETLEPISWDEWLKAFDGNNLALIVQDRTAQGRRSNFNKLVDRKTVEAILQSRRPGRGAQAGRVGRNSRSRSAGGARSGAATQKAKSATGGRKKAQSAAAARPRKNAAAGRKRASAASKGATRKGASTRS
jgi:hypothetical protein